MIGSVERVVYHNPDNGWCVLKVKVKGRRRLVTIVGHSPFVVAGETVEAEGDWNESAQHGERLIAKTLRTTLPRAAHAAEKYLSSGFVKGIGPQMANRLVERFGGNVFEVIEQAPSLLRDVPGIGPVRAESIRNSWHEQLALKEIMEFLGAHGISATKAPRIFRTFGLKALDVIKLNPYRLAREVPGIGFKTADLIASHLALPKGSEERFASAIHDRLQMAIARGHCAFPRDRLLKEAGNLVEYAWQDLIPALESEIESGRLIEEELQNSNVATICIFPAQLASSEQKLALGLMRLFSGKVPWISQLEAPLERFTLSDAQLTALKGILSSKVSILTGGPGTGKTVLIRYVTRVLQQNRFRVHCAAPTGRASQRLVEAAGVQAQTLHRLLGWNKSKNGFRHDADDPLVTDLLIIDEASMVGVEMMESVVRALPSRAALLLVGDQDQLPSVQAGRVLESIIESKVFPHFHIDEVFRQKGGESSSIIRAAKEILKGQMPDLKSSSPQQEFHFIEASTPVACLGKIETLVAERIANRFGFDPRKDIQVLCPMNKGEVGARALNRRLQSVLNSNPVDKIERFGQSICIGDKVIVNVNDYEKEVFNGDIGKVVQIERERSSLRVDFDGRRVDFDFNELDSLALAYAITIHKSQGSEYDAVVVPVLEESAALLSRNLLYTAVTRGKKLVVIVGSSKAFFSSLRSHPRLEKRWSALDSRLRKISDCVG